jgi:hypothetical protein
MAFDPKRASITEAAEIAPGSGRLPRLRPVSMKPRNRQWMPHMRNIVDEAGEIIAIATDDHTLIGGHHRLAVAASLGKKLFWQDTGEPVKLNPFFGGSSHRKTA